MKTPALFILLFFLNSFFCQQTVADYVPTILISKESEEEILVFVEEEATFPESHGSLILWILKNFHYPQSAFEEGKIGRVYLEFVVEKDGSITNTLVIRGIPNCPECDAEALRLLQSMPNWKAGRHNGKAVRTRVRIPINFSIA